MIEVILAGRPNSGKSTLFNKLADANQKVGNYAGCTVEKKTASVVQNGEIRFELTDLPGLYSLQPNSLDEQVAIRHLQEKKDTGFVVFVLDGNNLEQELVLPLQLRKQGYRIAIAVNMMDEVRANKRILNLAGMQDLAGLPFFPLAARSGEGVDSLKKFLLTREFAQAAGAGSGDHRKEAKAEARKLSALSESPKENVLLQRDSRLDSLLLHRFLGPVVFFLLMFVIFQSIFTWAAPLSDGVEAGIGWLQGEVNARVTHELFASLLSDGLLAGVGAVLVFVPQIAILFLLIGLLEYSGYLPRMAYMVDRLMKPYGLDGKVFIPLLSSVACAVPGIMATRTIESERRRLITIMISPLMTCSARLPVYTLLISTFVAPVAVGPFSLQGLVMFGMYALAIVVALAVALLLHRFSFQGRKHVVDFLHLPHYRQPNWPELFRFVWLRVLAFLKKAGTIIAAMAILLWFLLTFPRSHENHVPLLGEIEQAETVGAEEQLADLTARHESLHLENSYGGRLGKFLEPVFLPIGYDWKMTIGIIASLAAREVFVSTLGTVFALGEVDETSSQLGEVLSQSKRADGTPAYTLATCLSLLVFFAFSLQCVSTIGVARRETNSWKIPLLMFGYMFFLAYGSAFLVFHLTSALL